MSIVTSQPAAQARTVMARHGHPASNNGSYARRDDTIESCPPGLEYLSNTDQLVVRHTVELLEVFTGFETSNKYAIVNSKGQTMYYAIEENDWATRVCCGPGRPFSIKILDNNGTEAIQLKRNLSCPFYCLPWFPQTVQISAPAGSVIGNVVQEGGTFCNPASFKVKDYAGKTFFTIKGPCWHCSCRETQYQVLCRNGINELGVIKKKWGGLLKEAQTDADNFGITYPQELDVTMKANLLGASFLIDFMFFEKYNNFL